MLRAVMHGYYMDLRLYNKAKLIANPFDYTDFMKRKVQQKITEDNQRGIQTKVTGSSLLHGIKLPGHGLKIFAVDNIILFPAI